MNRTLDRLLQFEVILPACLALLLVLVLLDAPGCSVYPGADDPQPPSLLDSAK